MQTISISRKKDDFAYTASITGDVMVVTLEHGNDMQQTIVVLNRETKTAKIIGKTRPDGQITGLDFNGDAVGTAWLTTDLLNEDITTMIGPDADPRNFRLAFDTDRSIIIESTGTDEVFRVMKISSDGMTAKEFAVPTE